LIWDIDHVPSMNFNWLPFTPSSRLLRSFRRGVSDLHIVNLTHLLGIKYSEDTEKLFSKLKSHELYRKVRPNHDAFLTSKTFVTSTSVGGHIANPTNTTDSSNLKFALSSFCAASDEQYESIPNDEIVLLIAQGEEEIS
jgi:hypothetical protein